MDMTEKQLSSEYKFRGRIMTARVDEVSLPNGKTAPREVCEHVGGVGVLPIDKDGNVSSVMEMSIDMTLIHTLQHQLQASERTHKAIFDSIPNAVFLLDAAELTILDCNPASVKMYGRQRENELIGRGILDLFLPEEREQYASQLRAFTVFSGVTNIKADGTPLRVDIRSA